MVKQTSILWTVVITLGALSCTWRRAGGQKATAILKLYNSTTQLIPNIRVVPRGTTVLVECRVTPHQQQIHYRWTCPHPPCDGEYRKIYNNLILIVATDTTSGEYKCIPDPPGNETSAMLIVPETFVKGNLSLHIKSKLLLQNTLITDLQQIPKGLGCTTGRGVEPYRKPRFRFDGRNVVISTTEDQITAGTVTVTATTSQLNKTNGQYTCYEGGRERTFFIYIGTAYLPKPYVLQTNNNNEEQLRVVMTKPEGYNSGRFILRYDCGVGGIHTEFEYWSDVISDNNTNKVTRRNRSCFVVGQISRVTVWFVNGANISTPAVVPIERRDETGFSTEPSTTTRSSVTHTPSDSETSNNLQTSSIANPYPATPTDTNAPNDNDASSEKTKPSDEEGSILYIGGAAGGVILLLVGVLVLIICTIGLVTRRGKRNRPTHHNHSHYYSTVQEREQQAHNNTPPPVEQKVDNFNTGGFYDEVEVKLQPTPVAEPSEYQMVDDAGDVVKVQEGDSERKDSAVANPEDLYAQPDKKLKKNKSKEQDAGDKQKEEVQNPELLYAVVDKPKKKKGKDKKTKEKDDLEQQPGELLYAEVNKPKKKGKKDKKKRVQKEEISRNEKEPTPLSETPIDTGLTYEPSADTDDTQHQQDGEVNTTQSTPSANAEGLYAEVDKTQKIINN